MECAVKEKHLVDHSAERVGVRAVLPVAEAHTALGCIPFFADLPFGDNCAVQHKAEGIIIIAERNVIPFIEVKLTVSF